MPASTSQKSVPVTPWIGDLSGTSAIPLIVPNGYDFQCDKAVFTFNNGATQVLKLIDDLGVTWLAIVANASDLPARGLLVVPLDFVMPGGHTYNLQVSPGGCFYTFSGSYLSPPGASLL